MERHLDFGKRANSDALKIKKMYDDPKTRGRALSEIENIKTGWRKKGEGCDGMILTRLVAMGIIEAEFS